MREQLPHERDVRIERLRTLLQACRMRNARLVEDCMAAESMQKCGRMRVQISALTKEVTELRRQLEDARAEIAIKRGYRAEAAE
jgi:hypothetical protein